MNSLLFFKDRSLLNTIILDITARPYIVYMLRDMDILEDWAKIKKVSSRFNLVLKMCLLNDKVHCFYTICFPPQYILMTNLTMHTISLTHTMCICKWTPNECHNQALGRCLHLKRQINILLVHSCNEGCYSISQLDCKVVMFFCKDSSPVYPHI